MHDWLPFLALLAFVFVLGMVTWLKVHRAAGFFAAISANMDAPIRNIGGASAVAAFALAATFVALGIDVRGAAAIAAVCGLGGFFTMLGALGMEGVLLERDSEQRLAEGRPPPSTTRGRVIAVLVGLAPIVGCAWVLLQ